MKNIDWRAWLWQYGLPLLIIVGADVILLWLATHGVLADDLGLLLLIVLVVQPGLAFLCGLLFRPPHIWVVPALWVVVLLILPPIIGIVVNGPPGPRPPNAPDPISMVQPLLVNVVPMIVTMWLGREVRRWLDRNQLGRHQGPRAPAT
ncbi:MAG TPA: hypothetical protein VFN57_04175 [Thermomicrobiaceae bacterium]|nr:hypothetical protein [Thermomicrobiaceae bacterium]